MEQRAIEPGLLRVFRNYCGFAVCYFFGNFLYTFLTTKTLISPTSLLFLMDSFIFLLLTGYLIWGWLERKLKGLFLPIGLMIAALAPIYTGAYLWPFQVQNPLTDIVYRSWMLFPILIVPIVLVAWQYNFKITLALVVLTAFYDLPFILLSAGEINLETIPFIGVPILRSIALGIVGTIVSMLMTTQRSQRKRLMDANQMLSQHTQTLEQLATSRERNRLARELHDTLAHTLSSQILTLEALKLSSDPEDGELNQSLDQMIASTRKGLADTRRALKDLRAKPLDDLGLASALENLVTNAASRAGISAACRISESLPPMSSRVEQCLYRISQEAIENIVRHANASALELKLTEKKGKILLEIRDNGKGFNIQAIDSREKLGVRGMRERAAEAGCIFKIESQPDSGTIIRITFEEK